ncbi:MAG: hypothetical protein K0S47_1941 [Herbinix sp.]|jgi:hypothetical protein|nr:hypothetical protein [Herbinix sp.]
MKKKVLCCTLFLTLSLALLGCNTKKTEPLSLDEFQEIFTTIKGEVVELSSDPHTEKATTIIMGNMHDVNIVYYQMETEEDAVELFTTISEELDEKDNVSTSGNSSSVYWLRCSEGSYYLKMDSNIVLYGTGFEDDDIELKYLFYKLGYYKYDTTYIKNQVEVNEQTLGY